MGCNVTKCKMMMIFEYIYIYLQGTIKFLDNQFEDEDDLQSNAVCNYNMIIVIISKVIKTGNWQVNHFSVEYMERVFLALGNS
jgi:hypothetical protein